jgi:hypothetical protein
MLLALAAVLAALAPALAFHGEEVALTCVPCNATEFCHGGLRTRCPAHSRSGFDGGEAADIDDCVCVPGYLREADVCNLGEEPYWYIEGVLQTCAEFPRRVTVTSGAWRAEQCVCVPGYSEVEAFGNTVAGTCAKCPADSYNSQHNASCVRCPAHSSHLEQARTTITACTCDAGFSGLDGGPCVACENGFAKPLNGSQNCETCGPNTYSNGSASAACVACHGNSTALAGSAVVADCKCDPGFELVDGLCAQCAAGKFKGASGNGACELCAAGEFAGAAGTTACVACHADSDAEATRERCLCNAGYVQASAAALHPTCTACAAGTYQNVTGQTACVDCDARAQSAAASTDIGACVCNAGYRDVEYGGCAACLPGEYKEEVDETAACADCPADSHSPAASPAAEACLCNAGFDGPDGGPCAACATGKYKAGNGSAACAFCAADTFSDAEAATACTECFDYGLAPVGSTGLADCVCDVASGWSEFDDAGARACSQCAPGTYATAEGFDTGAGCRNCSQGTFTYRYGQTVCDACAANTSSYTSPRDECECDAGYRCPALRGTCDGDCEACEADTFKEAPGYAPACTACQADAQSPPASTDKSACLCNAGFFHEQDYASAPPYTCAACAAGSYTDVPGEPGCTACPASHFTPTALHPWDAAADCAACALCPAHEYDAARGGLGCGRDVPTACAACPANAGTWRNDSLAERNANVTACACNAGYYGPLGGPCALCPAGHVKTERLGRDTTVADCVQCPADTFEVEQHLPCRACLAHSAAPAGSTQKQHCECAAGRENADDDVWAFLDEHGAAGLQSADLPKAFAGAFEDGGLTVCRRCARGDHKPAAGNQRCDACAADTFQNATGMAYCAACPANMSSGAAATECYCDPSFENVDGEHHDCTLCRPASYKTAHGNQECTACDACAADEQVATACAPGANITCKACQAQAWNPAGSTRRGPCLCNAGYELAFDAQYADGYGCEACAVGEYRSTDLNNSVPCRTCGPLTFTTQAATVLCEACAELCDDTHDSSTEAYFVSAECTPSTDIVCTRCTVCPAGSYANVTCGRAFNNDRSDTTCDRCPAGAYCPGNGSQPQACPGHSTSPPGSVLAESCRCHPGYYQSDVHLFGAQKDQPIFDSLGLPSHLCYACDADTYCTGDGTVTQCPAHSFTRHTTSSHRLDCQCFPGYYRAGDQATFDTAFTCALCTPNDYCFNNSRYNCSDERMLSEAGSANFANCTCMAGYYNNGTRCEACHVDTYCVGDGVPRACPAHEWTSGERAYSECYCQPGFHSPALPVASPKGCELCPVGSFCPGEFDARWNCTAHSTSAAGSAVDVDCKCLPGFGNVSLHALLPDDTPTFHACAACAAGRFKETTANAACEACTVCLPDPDGVYELQACRADYDARCGPCDPCTNGSIWTSQACALKLDAVCSPCAACDYAREFLDEECSSQQNAVCRNISYGLACPVGEYAGGHTARTDSVCGPCAYRDAAYFGQRLHAAASPGTQYNDAYSCEIRCLGLSRMVSVLNHSLGCVSCETGNVLLREFAVVPDAEGRAAACEFACRAGFEFDAARQDCFAPVLRSSTRNAFMHSLNVSNWARTAAGHLFTVTHSNHSRFAVVAGRAAPTSCRHEECCFGQLWRVSSLAQLGLPAWAAENCSRSPALLHSTVHTDTLEFEVPDARLSEVASCAWVGNATQECTLVVSLVDTVLRRSYSQTVVLRTRRATTLALLNGAHVYVPLDAIRVDVLLAAREPATGTAVYLVVTQMRSARGAQNVTLRVPGMTPVATTCPHYSFPADTAFPAQPSVMVGTEVGTDRLYSFAAFWRGADTLAVVRLFYALRTGDDIMDVAAVRNVSLLEPVCTPHRRTSVVQLGFVDAAAGLGAHVVEAMHRLHAAAEPTRTTRGELGSLVTFVAEAYSPDVTDIRVKTVLAAHTSAAVALAVMQNATAYEGGALDFRYGFRQWCRAPDVPVKCVYEYLHLDSRGRTMHVVGCSDAGRAAARAWIRATLGAVHDGGHVDALCARVAAARHRALGVLVNTLAYVARGSVWNAYHNASRPATTTFVWPDMQFVS